MIIKQAAPYVKTFFMVSSSDHVSGLAGLVSSMSIQRSKTGGAFTGLNTGASLLAPFDLGSGWYYMQLDVNDTSGPNGEFDLHVTATGADALDIRDQINIQVVSDLTVTNNNLNIASNLKRGQFAIVDFQMTNSSTHAPQPGLTITAQRSLDGATFAACANTPTEISNGNYTHTLAGIDMNGGAILVHYSAPGADPLNMTLLTQ